MAQGLHTHLVEARRLWAFCVVLLLLGATRLIRVLVEILWQIPGVLRILQIIVLIVWCLGLIVWCLGCLIVRVWDTFNVLFLEQWCWTLLDEAWTVARPLALHGFPPDL